MTFYPRKCALKIAGKGKPVFPCSPENKRPLTKHGFKDATTDLGRVTAYFTKHPDALIGMPTGKLSGVFVVDEDRPGAVEELPHELPETLTIQTRSGGRHFYFNYVEGINNSPGELPNEIDVRGEGGYVIVPPSEGYKVLNQAPIADAPQWLLEMLRAKKKHSPGAGGFAGQDGTINFDSIEPIPDGSRNSALASIGGALRARGQEHHEIEAALLEINASRCTPPLPGGEVRQVAASVSRYPAGKAPPSPEALALLDEVEAAMWAEEEDFKGNAGKTNWNFMVALLKEARAHGTVVPAGVEVSTDVRSLALAAGTGSTTTQRSAVKRLIEAGWIRRGKRGSLGVAGSFVILKPKTTPRETDTINQVRLVRGEDGCLVSISRVPRGAPFTAPRLRRSSPGYRPKRGRVRGTRKPRVGPTASPGPPQKRIGPGCNPVVDYLEKNGGTATLENLAAALGMRRARDLIRRKTAHPKSRDGLVTRLGDAGVVEVVGREVRLVEGWLEALNDERERAGEIEDLRRDMKNHADQRRAY